MLQRHHAVCEHRRGRQRTGGQRAGCVAAGASEAASGAAGGGDLTGQTVSVIGTWGGDEEAAFKEMVAPWEAQTGAKVSYTGTRDLNTVLTTGVASGVLPDLAGLPGPGQMAQWADSLIDLSTVLDVPTYESETAPALVELGKVNGKTVGVFIKTAVKGLMWFDPKVVDFGATPPATWDDLQAALTANASKAKQAWCLGIESGAATGWPATDWIEDLVLRQAGPDVYNSWWQGKTKWTDPAIKTAFQTYGDVVKGAFGGSDAVITTNFEVAGNPLFATPPGCLLLHQAQLHHRPRRLQDQDRRDRLQLLPVPRHQPAVHGRDRGRGRPVRHVPRHAGRQVADGLPRHRAGPGHLGQARRRAVREQERHRLSR